MSHFRLASRVQRLNERVREDDQRHFGEDATWAKQANLMCQRPMGQRRRGYITMRVITLSMLYRNCHHSLVVSWHAREVLTAVHERRPRSVIHELLKDPQHLPATKLLRLLLAMHALHPANLASKCGLRLGVLITEDDVHVDECTVGFAAVQRLARRYWR